MTVISSDSIHHLRTSKLSRQFEGMLKTMQPLLEEKFGWDEALQFRQDVVHLFNEQVLPTIPDIGGRKNIYNPYLQQTGMALALYRLVKTRGGTLETAGELIYRGMMMVIARYPRFFLHLYGRLSNSKLAYPRIRRGSLISKKRKYPLDWVYEFVEGDGQSFNYGIDMLECGILKYLDQQNALELAPYLCAVDYITFESMGIELQRKETLAAGCQRCTFRIIV